MLGRRCSARSGIFFQPKNESNKMEPFEDNMWEAQVFAWIMQETGSSQTEEDHDDESID